MRHFELNRTLQIIESKTGKPSPSFCDSGISETGISINTTRICSYISMLSLRIKHFNLMHTDRASFLSVIQQVAVISVLFSLAVSMRLLLSSSVSNAECEQGNGAGAEMKDQFSCLSMLDGCTLNCPFLCSQSFFFLCFFFLRSKCFLLSRMYTQLCITKTRQLIMSQRYHVTRGQFREEARKTKREKAAGWGRDKLVGFRYKSGVMKRC